MVWSGLGSTEKLRKSQENNNKIKEACKKTIRKPMMHFGKHGRINDTSEWTPNNGFQEIIVVEIIAVQIIARLGQSRLLAYMYACAHVSFRSDCQAPSLEPPMRAPTVKNRTEDAGTNTGRHKQTKSIQIPINSGRGRADVRCKRPARILSPVVGVVVPSTEFFAYNLDRIRTIPHKDKIRYSTLV